MKLKIFNIIKIIYYLFTLKTNEVRNILLKYPDYIFLNSSSKKNEIMRGYYSNLPFNGQKIRTKMVNNIIEKFSPELIIETGTYFGNTLEHFLSYGVPVYSIEINSEFYFVAKSRFIDNHNLYLYNSDSVSELKKIKKESQRAFVYLDAHWYKELPLDEELRILEKYREVVIVIDDFQVPENSLWKFDNYDKTQLDIQNVSIPDSFKLYFPNYDPIDDGGFMTGCLVLAKGTKSNKVLIENKYLKAH